MMTGTLQRQGMSTLGSLTAVISRISLHNLNGVGFF